MPSSSSPSFASERVAESTYDQPTSSNYTHETSSSQHSSSHDEYTPNSPPNTPPLVSGATSASDVYTTPSHRSSTAISQKTRDALLEFYNRIYGSNSKLCLVTRRHDPLIAHIVRRASSPEQLSLYEYCLGCDWNTFHVDSRRNLAYLSADLHNVFDAGKWLLLPDLSTLQEVEIFVLSVLTARQNGSAIENFLSKWNVDIKTKYTFMPLPDLSDDPIFRRASNRSDSSNAWEQFLYPFDSLPPLECHVSPPLAVINGGPKLANLDLNAVSLTYHKQESNETQLATKERLTILNRIWGLINGAKEFAKEWETENRRKKRKRHQDDDDLNTQRTRRNTRSSTNSGRESEPARHSGGPRPKKNLGARKRDRETMSSSTTLTSDVLLQLGKRHRSVDRIKEWVETTARCRPK